MKHIFIILLLLSLAFPCFSLSITNNGKAKAVVVLGKDAIEPEKYAANEFVKYIEQISGAKLEIVNKPSKSLSNIYIGQTTETKKVYNTNWNALKFDGICIVSRSNNLILAGDRPRGSIYAVYEFLEKYLNCQFFTDTVETVPKTPTITIKSINYIYVPALKYREMFNAPALHHTDYSIKRKLNGHYNDIPKEKGGHYSIIGWCHTFDQLLPYDKYGKDHPEWYSSVNGKRQSGYTQLCLTNPEVIENLSEKVLEECRKNPDAGYISVSMNDNTIYCQCDNCNAFVKKYGNQSDLLLWAVNKVAKKVKKEFPDFMVDTLAYTYTREAPKTIKADDNVIVRICPIEADFTKPKTAKENENIYKYVNEWKKMSKNLFAWNYIAWYGNFYLMHPGILNLKPDIIFYEQSNIKGIFEQGDAYNEDMSLNKLKTYVGAKLLWNPNLDPITLIKDFDNAYYGPEAGKYMTDFVLLFEKLAIKSDKSKGEQPLNNAFIDNDNMIKEFKFLEKAYNATLNNETLNKRVITQMLCFQMAWLNKSAKDREYINSNTNLLYKNKIDFLNAFVKHCKATDNVFYGEGFHMDKSILGLDFNAPLVKSKNIPKEAKDIPNSDWVEFQPKDLQLYALGSYTFLEDDPSSPTGKTARLVNNNVEWVLQCNFANLIFTDIEKADIYADVKIDLGNESGNLFGYGTYDGIIGHGAYVNRDDYKNIGEYQTIYLGKRDITPGMYFYIFPTNNPNICKNIYIARIFMIKSK